ncbi:class I SAM-dependent methyltransferase [Kribbella deserti]|uniref:Methyltransferase domain-containing protein n=1 Tax=Kribbella deserti TaxID=1926257 RepID=A0ABV6QGN0_9ACTN
MTTTLERPTIDVDPDVLAFYTDRCDEGARLTSTIRGRLEAMRLRELLMAHLPANGGRVADVGGGPGVHATWLQAEGHSVDLLDPIPRHINTARNTGIRSAVLGDARSLPWADATYDAVLLAGPVYHLPPAGRVLALREAARVVRPGGVIAAVAVNRYANLMGAAVANQLDERREIVNAILTNGYSANNDRVPHMYYHSPDELAAEFTDAGLSRVEVKGLTGPGGWLTVAVDRHFLETGTPLPSTLTRHDPLQTALTAARHADAYPDLTASSAQLMAFGYRD